MSFFGHGLNSYFDNRRRQLQDWEAAPPVNLGLLLFVSSLLSFGLALWLIRHPQALFLFVGIPLFELILLGSTIAIAIPLRMRGRIQTLFVFINIGTWPILLTAPLALVSVYLPRLEILWMGCGAYLFLKTMGNWRESIEVAYEFSSLQATLVLAISGFVLFLAGLPFYG